MRYQEIRTGMPEEQVSLIVKARETRSIIAFYKRYIATTITIKNAFPDIELEADKLIATAKELISANEKLLVDIELRYGLMFDD